MVRSALGQKYLLHPLHGIDMKRRPMSGPATARGRGGIGRRAGFRFQWVTLWGFESLRPHQSLAPLSMILGWQMRPVKTFPCREAAAVKLKVWKAT